MIVYNGNFFCNSFDAIEYDKQAKDVVLIPGTCSWALPSPPSRKMDRALARELSRKGHAARINHN